MKKFKRALVALDLSLMDGQLMQFLADNASALGIQKVYFVHIMPDFSVPGNADIEFHKLFAPEYPVDEKVRDKLGFDIQKAFGDDPPFEYEIEVIEGKPYEKLLHWLKIKDIDLLVAGKKKVSDGSGITAKRVARNAGCNILIFPADASCKIQTLLVPMDFSEHSVVTVELAGKIRQRLPEARIQGLYVVDLPPEDYYSRSRPGTGYRAILVESAHTAFDSFCQANKIPKDSMEMSFIENTLNSIPAHIEACAEAAEGPLIIMGARGHSPFETFLFGSVTEKLANQVEQAPLLIVR